MKGWKSEREKLSLENKNLQLERDKKHWRLKIWLTASRLSKMRARV